MQPAKIYNLYLILMFFCIHMQYFEAKEFKSDEKSKKFCLSCVKICKHVKVIEISEPITHSPQQFLILNNLEFNFKN